MATLHVRNVPDALYERLRRQAEAQNRSLSAEILVLLDRALVEDPNSQRETPARIGRRRAYSPMAAGAPDSTILLRADREGEPAPPSGRPVHDAGGAYTGVNLADGELNDRLVAEARQLGHHMTAAAAVEAALEEYITRQRRRAILDLFGTIDYNPEYDYKAQRRYERPR
ncbi:MAG: type II toxin-antitoxin system VapB family antitoxin [Candidatus Promineofilum sp.]|nr:type II toxin-antitoxin system VapB family antitoxin [Promineifilum sp.]MCW5863433.1 type II toxin-antitoxin system VapB family antitoxin [Anaerolineae bacterium]